MESDPLTTPGYFSEFSWYSLDDDGRQDTSIAPLDGPQLRAAAEELAPAYRDEAQPPEDSPDARAGLSARS